MQTQQPKKKVSKRNVEYKPLRKHTKIRILAYTTVFLFLTIFLLTKPSASQISYNWKWSSDVHFKLPAYNTVIAFDDSIYLNSFEWDEANATKITFNNVKMDGETLDSWSVSVQNANITVNDLFKEYTFQATVTAPTDTLTTTIISSGAFGSPHNVYVDSVIMGHIGKEFFDGATSNCWAYDGEKLYIKAVTSSPTVIKALWSAGGSPSVPSPAPPEEPSPVPIPPAILPSPKYVINFEYLSYFLLAVGCVLLISMFAKARKPKTIEALWRRKVSIDKKTRLSPWIPIIVYVLFILVWFTVLKRLLYG